jgi:hypothetical protein
MKLDEARSVKWPFREIKGQAMGDLYDTGKISLQDLGYAIQKAYSKQVREASRTLLLHALSERSDKASPISAPLNVITSEHRSFAERRQIQFAILEGAIMGLGMGILIMIFIQQVIASAGRESVNETSSTLMTSPQRIIAVIIVLLLGAGIIFLFFRILNWMIDRIDNQIQLHRKGQRGEERVLNAMYHALDDKAVPDLKPIRIW